MGTGKDLIQSWQHYWKVLEAWRSLPAQLSCTTLVYHFDIFCMVFS